MAMLQRHSSKVPRRSKLSRKLPKDEGKGNAYIITYIFFYNLKFKNKLKESLSQSGRKKLPMQFNVCHHKKNRHSSLVTLRKVQPVTRKMSSVEERAEITLTYKTVCGHLNYLFIPCVAYITLQTYPVMCFKN